MKTVVVSRACRYWLIPWKKIKKKLISDFNYNCTANLCHLLLQLLLLLLFH